ncbi:Transposon Tf2-6 polyprotein-like protein, partial [Dinothrombium tinctorium]
MQFPTPKTLENVRQFLGLSSYYRRFIENYSKIAEPLSRLTKKDVKYVWETEQEIAFNILKDKLVKSPVLAHFDPSLDIEVRCDGSGIGRNPVGDPIEAKDVTERTLVVNVETLTSEEIRERQLRDPKISKIMRLLPKYEHLSCRDRKKLKKFHINEQGLLYRKVENHSADKLCIVIPRCLRKDLYSMHDDPLSGHLGQKKTFERINSRFYFPGMRKYINRYVKTCVECQTRKFPTVPPAGLLQPIIVGGVCEKFGLDILGPFPKSLRDNKYIIVGTEYLTRFAI